MLGTTLFACNKDHCVAVSPHGLLFSCAWAICSGVWPAVVTGTAGRATIGAFPTIGVAFTTGGLTGGFGVTGIGLCATGLIFRVGGAMRIGDVIPPPPRPPTGSISPLPLVRYSGALSGRTPKPRCEKVYIYFFLSNKYAPTPPATQNHQGQVVTSVHEKLAGNSVSVLAATTGVVAAGFVLTATGVRLAGGAGFGLREAQIDSASGPALLIRHCG